MHRLLRDAVRNLDVEKARREVDRYVRDKRALEAWSRDFFLQVAQRIEPV